MESYQEYPGKIRGKIRGKRRRRRTSNDHNDCAHLLGETLKIEYRREKVRRKFLESKEWMSLNKREKKEVRHLFRDQRSLSTQFLEQVTNVTHARHGRGRLHRGNPAAGHRSRNDERSERRRQPYYQHDQDEMMKEVKEWSKVSLDILSCISLDQHGSSATSKRRSRRRHKHKHSRSDSSLARSLQKKKDSRVGRDDGSSVTLPAIVIGGGENSEVANVSTPALGETLDTAFTLPTEEEEEKEKEEEDERGRGGIRGGIRGSKSKSKKRRRKKGRKEGSDSMQMIPGSQLKDFQYDKTKEWNFPIGTKQPWSESKLGTHEKGKKRRQQQKKKKQHSMENIEKSFFIRKMNAPAWTSIPHRKSPLVSPH